jgi:hypothetical protein
MIVNATDRYVNASPFFKSLGTIKRVPIVSAAVAYDDPRSGKVFVLIIHQALHFPDMKRCLLCPMQVRLNDVVINERPKFLTTNPTDKDHTIVVDDLVICLKIHNVASYFEARTPTKKEYHECTRIELTYPLPEWSPHDPKYVEEEKKRTDEEGYNRHFHSDNRISCITHDEHDFLHGITEDGARTIDECNNDDTCDDVKIVASDISSIHSEKFKLSPEVLCMNWCIGRKIAERKLDATTQLRVKTVVNPSIERRWPTGNRPLRYRRLDYNVYHDKMHSKIVSLHGHKCCEIYVTNFGWSR